jgi:RsiW-degrading membrane proteinase PrsW (M82 family)
MHDTRTGPSAYTPDTKPADLPDLPLRSCYALLVLAVALAALVVVLFLVALVSTADRPSFAVLLLLPPLTWAAVLIWRSLRRAWLRDAGEWWRVSLSEDRKGLRLVWQAQRWRDLTPWRKPTAWSEPLPLLVMVSGSVLILVYALAYRDPDVAMIAAIWPFGWVGFLLAFLVIVPPLFVPFQQKAKSYAVLNSEGVSYFPPNLSYEPPPGRMTIQALALGGTSFMRILTRGVRFAPDGVAIVGPRRFGIIPNHFIIPTRAPDIRARIRASAEEHRIPVSGEV